MGLTHEPPLRPDGTPDFRAWCERIRDRWPERSPRRRDWHAEQDK